MWRLGRGLFEPAVRRRLFRVVKLGAMHHSVHLQREVHLRFAFGRSCWDRAEKPFFGAASVSPWSWDEGPGVAEDFPQ